MQFFNQRADRADQTIGILEELWKHRHKPLVSFNLALKDLSIPPKIKGNILRQLVSGGLIEYKLLPYSGLGSGQITLPGINVVEGTASPPFPIVLHQHIQTGGIHFGKNVSGVGTARLHHRILDRPHRAND